MVNEPTSTISFQTVKLSRGNHASPADGACVMELASMLGGEPFTDHPQSVCPVIGAFLRVYNDSLDDRRRQDLYRFAALAVGTRGTRTVEHLRIERCLLWAEEQIEARSWFARHFKRSYFPSRRLSDAEAAALTALKSIGRLTDEVHRSALALVDELCSIRGESVATWTLAQRSLERDGLGLREQLGTG
jgi:hypothetical protein